MKTKVNKSSDAIESIVKTLAIIKDIKSNSITNDAYTLMRLDKESANLLLQKLDTDSPQHAGKPVEFNGCVRNPEQMGDA